MLLALFTRPFQFMYKKLLKISIVLALIVVILGAWTRLGDAGLGCPDWPLCYGQFTVPDVIDGTKIEGYERPVEAAKGWKEVIHRYAASLLGLVIFALFFLAYKGKTQRPQSLKLPGFTALFVMLQGAFGMWTVTLLVHPGIVTTHLIGGFATTVLLTWLLLNQSKPPITYRHILKRHKWLLAITLFILSLQIILGGWTSTNYAALSCGEQFPLCLNSWWPEMDFIKALYWGPIGVDYEYGVLAETARAGIQMMHRIGALITTLSIIALIYLFRNYQHLQSNLIIIGGLLITQVILGILNVLFSIPMPIAVGHNAIALLLLLSLIALIHKTSASPN
ncbi:Heme A synthase, cytochrome oxidase biogenesis protein Cox15-CtaA [uncultured Candidatus Thioglobus sp.]|nr:Heme A synthase, cytochrome oxidase biogenesis protein Cox15-CtaA [uncultured Candidatus Thioglobus sp.]SMM98252.1 Heme A synthase, cytochrome oxidase biogenesis protein Cox15-CtaA [uncultured Candidatus Thioglobus sp.]SMM98330.1 Heme A synthase, cytochrome oxidase biogenesis protein Cox15-CtaA [uncultured Candidatus Thioglobus sp.]